MKKRTIEPKTVINRPTSSFLIISSPPEPNIMERMTQVKHKIDTFCEGLF